MQKMYIFLIFFLTFTANELCLADDKPSKFDNITISAGNWFENFKAVQTNDSGSTDGFEIAPFFATSIDYNLKPGWTLTPEVGWVVQREAGDSRISKNLFFLRFDVGYWAYDKLRLRAGTSLMILNMSANGGEETLSNGDSSETYYIPTERRTALNQTLDFGAEYLVDRISVRGSAYIYAWLDSNERIITYSASINYLIPIKELK